MQSFIRKERRKLQAIRERLTPREQFHLSAKLNEVSHLIDLLEKSPLSQKQKQTISKEVEHLDTFSLNRGMVGDFHSLLSSVVRTKARHGEAETLAKWRSIQEGESPTDLESRGENYEEQVRKSLNETSEAFPKFRSNHEERVGNLFEVPPPPPKPSREESIRGLGRRVKSTFLSQGEANEIMDAPKSRRNSIVDNYEDQANVASDEFMGSGLSSVGYSLAGSVAASKLMDMADPDHKIPKSTRNVLIGGSGGALSQGLYSRAMAQEITAGSLAPATIGGALGAITQQATYKGLKKSGASEKTSDIVSGGVGGATAGAVFDAAAVGAEEGAEAGSFLGLPFTVAGGAMGALFGAGAYKLGKMMTGAKNLTDTLTR